MAAMSNGWSKSMPSGFQKGSWAAEMLRRRHRAAPAIARHFLNRRKVFQHYAVTGLVVSDLLGHLGPPM
jgi:hypothetical protein